MFTWNDHNKLKGCHAFLGASNHSWINWNDETMMQRYCSQFATTIGTGIHELAETCIKNRNKLGKYDKNLIHYAMIKNGVPKNAYDAETILENLVPYVNDAIGFHMDAEVILYFSKNCFGTTDAISFNEKERMLRIHDLKTGISPVKIEQLIIYAALFCLEYHKKPSEIKIELRIYQNGEVLYHIPEPEEVEKFMDLITTRDGFITEYIERNIK